MPHRRPAKAIAISAGLHSSVSVKTFQSGLNVQELALAIPRFIAILLNCHQEP